MKKEIEGREEEREDGSGRKQSGVDGEGGREKKKKKGGREAVFY